MNLRQGKISKAECARQLDVHKDTITKIENGQAEHVKHGTVLAYAKLFNHSMPLIAYNQDKTKCESVSVSSSPCSTKDQNRTRCPQCKN